MTKDTVVTKPVVETKSTWDIGALREDLPTAKELAQFVYNRTGIALDLVGKSKEIQYKVAVDVLDGKPAPKEFITKENPFVDKTDIIPTEELRAVPARDAKLPDVGSHFHIFTATNLPHPENPQSDDKVNVTFRKYACGTISYEVVGPIELKPVGVKLNKYGKEVPEQFVWSDTRTGEQVLQRPDGTLPTKRAQGLKVFMEGTYKAWHLVDRPLANAMQKALDNPWE
jgi:hypothetical protein